MDVILSLILWVCLFAFAPWWLSALLVALVVVGSEW